MKKRKFLKYTISIGIIISAVFVYFNYFGWHASAEGTLDKYLEMVKTGQAEQAYNLIDKSNPGQYPEREKFFDSIKSGGLIDYKIKEINYKNKDLAEIQFMMNYKNVEQKKTMRVKKINGEWKVLIRKVVEE
ncbi:hypothetical protein NDK47_06065 [Brevibacillus ruminantium]|uniref:DUF4878 domain-containing protein n=1 Tax=Brevibacillus ruminantium TaxID=2950604 RepID=A0ABY4WID9_9BACL|nr:hypothetical protein [Brevibacillus ruminantium]USG66862.1 hypothetical protein NDK47_06065 [Brevibacillus ruminantium]